MCECLQILDTFSRRVVVVLIASAPSSVVLIASAPSSVVSLTRGEPLDFNRYLICANPSDPLEDLQIWFPIDPTNVFKCLYFITGK